MHSEVPVITVDGPSGSGKGTISRMLAEKLHWHLLDSGALYRLVGLAAQRLSISLEDEAQLAKVARAMDVEFLLQDGAIRLSGEDVSGPLRTEEAGAAASKVAALPAVREALLQRQRAFARLPGLVADGRDMGTVVFPAARLKLFLTASPKMRAERRHKQLKEKGIDVSLPDLSWDIAQRDLRDENRPVAPLRPAKDARVLDSSSLNPEQVLDLILPWLHAAGIMTD
jgi:cytidylate kinase